MEVDMEVELKHNLDKIEKSGEGEPMLVSLASPAPMRP
jgi:hypothetical protein